METNYNVDYFIDKFSKIPEELIIPFSQYEGGGRGCALGQCNGTRNTEGSALIKLFNDNNFLSVHGPGEFGWAVADLNNGDNPYYQQPTPKQRILAALYDIKKLQEPEVKTVYKVVHVAEKIAEYDLVSCSN